MSQGAGPGPDPGPRRLAAAAIALALAASLLGAGVASASSTDPDGDGLTTAFEIHRSHTDPHRKDTDGDGTPDGREDQDHDGLVDIWEQRLSLDPLAPDTDGDGVRDGREDADHDGLGNRFEIRRSHTDPLVRDSNADGVRDSAEDPDADGLSNLGEYRYATNPNDPDTDHDGTTDWHEDSDGDNVPDGLTQDARPVPTRLTPSLARPRDRPRSWYSCHQGAGHTAPKVCIVGKHGPKVVLFGDSHALQWRAALERVGADRGWQLYFLTKSACPVADIAGSATDCVVWRQRALDKIRQIHPDLIIASNLNAYLDPPSNGRGSKVVRWRKALTRSLRALTAMAPRVVLLGDTPRWLNAATCLPDHLDDIAACAQRRSVASGPARIANDRAAAKAAGAKYVSPLALACPYDPCPPVIDDLLVAYDGGHMTLAFSRTLWRGLEARLPRP